MHDIIIVGGGPAGMTAALYAERNGKRALVIERSTFGGQITHSPKVENIPGTLSTSGNAFAEQMLDQVLQQGAEIEIENVIAVEDKGATKLVRTEEGGSYEGRAVILATGVRHRMLGLPGEEALVGEGISFCAVCDGDFYAGKEVIVVGGGNSALQEAILLSEKCSKVTIVQDLPNFTGEQKLQDVLFGKPNVEAHTNQKVTGLLEEGGSFRGISIENCASGEAIELTADGLFVAIGLIPENDAFRELADLNAYGYFDSDERCITKTPGVFVAGDCRCKDVRQVTTAAADGATAALLACRYIDGI